jgi:hypothetical protein
LQDSSHRFYHPWSALNEFMRKRFNQRALLAVLALLTLLFATSAGDLWHHHDIASRTCQVCHVAHMPLLARAPGVMLSAPTILAWTALRQSISNYLEPTSNYSSSRAPPA